MSERSVKPGDTFKVKVGGVEYDTVIDAHGAQRFKTNSAVEWLVQRMLEAFDGPDGQAVRRCGLDLNTMTVAYYKGEITQRDFAEFHMMHGYSVCGFRDLSSFEDMEIENPLWEDER